MTAVMIVAAPVKTAAPTIGSALPTISAVKGVPGGGGTTEEAEKAGSGAVTTSDAMRDEVDDAAANARRIATASGGL
jgi:hypothetical protein